MARLWMVHVVELSGDRVELDVRQAHPDAGAFPDSPTFALRVLHEPAWELDANFQERALGALGAACTSKQVLDDDWVTANVGRFIAKVEPQPPSAPALDDDAALRQLAAHLKLPAALDQLSEVDRGRLDDAYGEFWKDASQLPVRRYRITVTDPALLSHLTANARWPSAAFG
jgi:hypothetical protein